MEKDKKNKTPAEDIVTRAYKLNIPITELCRVAGVHRSWFEKFKKGPSKGIKAYLAMLDYLKSKEDGISGNTGETQGD